MKAIQPIQELSFHAADEVHDMTVPLDPHQIGYAYGAELADPPQVIPSQVYEHYVLRTLLFVLNQLIGQPRVFLCGFSPRPGSGNRPILHAAVAHFYQHLRRRTHQVKVVHPKEEHVGGGVDKAQRAIDIKGIT